MGLHTHEPHPRVHMIVKAVSEKGVRLNIRKGTPREWRQEFARHLRAQGISSNATERAVRGATRASLSDGMYRAMQHGASRRNHEQRGSPRRDQDITTEAPGKEKLVATRAEVERRWMAVAEILDREDQRDLAWSVRRFTEALPPVRTDRELWREALRTRDRRPPSEELVR